MKLAGNLKNEAWYNTITPVDSGRDPRGEGGNNSPKPVV